ncbi:hypothetical protein QQP08_024557 [Theobroma cacao]|nr:hypothetical protein QQP08_024557 [Theobroma cacao]
MRIQDLLQLILWIQWGITVTYNLTTCVSVVSCGTVEVFVQSLSWVSQRVWQQLAKRLQFRSQSNKIMVQVNELVIEISDQYDRRITESIILFMPTGQPQANNGFYYSSKNMQ